MYSYEVVDHVERNVPEQLSTGRWTFTQGDARENVERAPDTADFLFIDAAHSASFARWYIRELFPRMRPGIPVCVHDVFQATTLPCSDWQPPSACTHASSENRTQSQFRPYLGEQISLWLRRKDPRSAIPSARPNFPARRHHRSRNSLPWSVRRARLCGG
ncbi:class I SAM-dependent methyltransferase [Streptomyces sp. NBC_01518]|uniref:class I SAM-dependent methyltransferase n=1 Tax=Streptomyces sp. NBC_01518 TaxID=2903891 RepID=UPI0038704B1A